MFNLFPIVFFVMAFGPIVGAGYLSRGLKKSRLAEVKVRNRT